MKSAKLLSIAGVLVLLLIAIVSSRGSSAQMGAIYNESGAERMPVAVATRPLPTETPAPVARIVGGEPATPGEWPWQVVVYPPGYICGGVLISPQWVVTAGHCVTSGASIYLPSQIQLVLGEYRRSTTEQTEQLRQVSEVIRHPNYNSATLDYDIALLKLSAPATINEFVRTVPLLRSPIDDALIEPGDMTWVTGWGLTSNDTGATASDVLMEVELPIVSNAVCRQIWGGLTDNMLCAGYTEGGKDSCGGDSGGPLVAGGVDNWRLAGLVSYGSRTCGAPNVPGVYTRVSRFVDWIESHTGPLTQPTATSTTTVTATSTATATASSTPSSTPTPTRTATSTSTPTTTPTATSTPSANIVRNSNFDLGRNGDWLEEGRQLSRHIYSADETALPTSPYSGSYLAWLGGVDNELARLSQPVTVPQIAPILTFRYQIRSADTCGGDMLYVYLNSRVIMSLALCAENNTNGWVETPAVDLSADAGANRTLRFEVITNSTTASSLLLEDITLQSDTALPTATPTSQIEEQILKNPDFDSGPDGAWAERSTNFGSNPGALILSKDDLQLPLTPHSGSFMVWLGGVQSESASISQTVSINGIGKQLTYQFGIDSSDECGKDRLEVWFAETLLKQYELCAENRTQSWTQETVEMTSFSDRTGDLIFQISTDNTQVSNFYLDSVSLTVGPSPATPTATSTPLATPAATATPTAEPFRLESAGGPQAILLRWKPSSQLQVAEYAIEREDNGSFVRLATTQESFFLDVDDDAGNNLVTDTDYCYQISALGSDAAVLETSEPDCATFGRLHLGIPMLVGVSGEAAQVPINGGPMDGLRIDGGDLWLEYDPNVALPLGVSGATLTSNYTWTYTVGAVDATTERISIQVAPHAPDAPAPLYGEGTLAHIDFQILGQPGTQTPLNLVAPSANGGSQFTATDGITATTPLSLTLENGLLSVGDADTGYRLGDVNGDGILTGQDAMQTLIVSAQLRSATQQEIGSGDVNGNDMLDAGDSAQIMRRIDTGMWSTTQSSAEIEPSQAAMTTTLTLSSTSAIAGAKAILTLSAEGLEQVIGGEFVIVYDPARIIEFRAVKPTDLANSGVNVTFYDDRHGRLYVSMAGGTPIVGTGALLEINAVLSADTEPTQIVLAAATLYDETGRDLIRSTPGYTIIRQDGVITPVGGALYLPFVQR